MSEPSFPAERYSGKPFLRLVDTWLLSCIGFLDPQQESSLVAMTPKLQNVYNHSGSWNEIVRDQLGFPPGIEAEILRLWTHNQKLAQDAGQTLGPLQFVEMFVSANVEV